MRTAVVGHVEWVEFARVKRMPLSGEIVAGYAWNGWAENIASGQTTPASVMASWMNSAGHRANILGGRREIGVGHYEDTNDASGVRYASAGGCTPNTTIGGYRHYWTQNFGSRSAITPSSMARIEGRACSPSQDHVFLNQTVGRM